ETKSVLQQSLFQNKLLIISVIGAQVLHFVAMNVPMLSEILEINPVSPIEWSQYLFISLSLLIVSEIYKKYRSMKPYN
ncbi:MAG: cation transporting ATPase C-terminal domain-containing protein, partial [Gammaproteobacteria bacterium]|nr:cation transporting ATPase C-terminal domain-containing protein [Gammaproteobacteria bacterium]